MAFTFYMTPYSFSAFQCLGTCIKPPT